MLVCASGYTMHRIWHVFPQLGMSNMHNFFFFQAEDGIRDYKVTGVQTCALPICSCPRLTGGRPSILNQMASDPVKGMTEDVGAERTPGRAWLFPSVSSKKACCL